MKVLFSAHTNNSCISFGYAGRKTFEQLSRLADAEAVQMGSAARGDLHIHLGQPAGAPDRYATDWIRLRLPRYAPRFVAYAVCESTVIDPGWVEEFNTCAAVWTPSTFCREAFRRNGVTVPIRVVPHGVDPEEFPFMDRPRRPTFTYFWMGTSLLSDRKCGYLVEKAFTQLNLPDARLLLKTIPWPGGAMDFNVGKIRQIASWATPTAIRELHYEADCFVWPTRGEGFGMIPLEAMATGLPVICTDWSGPRDYLRDGVSLPLRNYRLQESIYGPAWGQDAGVDLEELKEKMLWCYQNREEAAEIGRAASFYVRHAWSWDQKVYGALRSALASLRVPLKEIHERAA